MAQTCTIETVAGNGVAHTAGSGGVHIHPHEAVGDGGLAIEAEIDPQSIVVDSLGNLFIADRSHCRVRKVTPDGIITTFAGNGSAVGDVNDAPLGDGGPAISAILCPARLVFDSAGNLYIADVDSDRIRKVTPAGIISTVVGLSSSTREEGVSANSFNLIFPRVLDVDAGGNIYFSDCSAPYRCWETIHKVSEGVVHRFAGTGRLGSRGDSGDDGGPALEAGIDVADFAFGNQGDLYIANGYSYIADGYNRIRKISADGIINDIAGGGAPGSLGDGGPATNAYLDVLYSIAVDSQENIFFGSAGRLRKISTNGVVTTIAGTGEGGFSGDGGPAAAARLNTPWDIAVDSGGNIYIADYSSHRIRKVTCRLQADLIIENASIVSGGGRRMVSVRVTIANRGEGEARGPFSIGVRPNWYTKPGFNSVQQILRRGQSLGAGETIERTLRLPAADSMELTIDSGRGVEESNEENNTFSLTP